MDYEKKYKNALEWARQVMNGETGFIRKDIKKVFPELAESEDERIRKECISIIDAWDKSCRLQGDYCEAAPECIAWLEKQGKQKPIIEMKSAEESLGIDSETYKKIVDECIYGNAEQKPVWSEEDEKILNFIIARLHSHPNVEAEEYDKDYHWLKSLKERCTWKPTTEQLIELRCVISGCSFETSILVELEENLKKLL